MGASSLQVGDFVMVFGGFQSETNVGISPRCSSVNNKYYNQRVTTEIWSIRKQVWIKGPFVPLDKGCIHGASGFAVNRTTGVILVAPFLLTCEDNQNRVRNIWQMEIWQMVHLTDDIFFEVDPK